MYVRLREEGGQAERGTSGMGSSPEPQGLIKGAVLVIGAVNS